MCRWRYDETAQIDQWWNDEVQKHFDLSKKFDDCTNYVILIYSGLY